ncbi:MAG: hypothetical protein WCG31_10930 [Deltaproteobacteria bacterium]
MMAVSAPTTIMETTKMVVMVHPCGLFNFGGTVDHLTMNERSSCIAKRDQA